jgi:7,8-dihydroneopterin aldolase/epimerase/oxygenase
MKIFVERLEFVGAHGVYDEERAEGRRFVVDLWAEVSGLDGGVTDELEHTLDYRALAEVVLSVGRGPSCALVERMASEMLARTFALDAHVARAGVTIRKHATGVPGDPGCVGVELVRSRGQAHVS